MSKSFFSYKYIFFIIIFALVFVQNTRANGFGVTLDKQVGDYVVNVDYDAIAGIYSGDAVQFAFQLFNKDRSKQLDFGDVWVNITPEKKGQIYSQSVFAGGIIGSSFPPSGMTFVFPSSGSYTLNLRYENADKAIAEASFPLEVRVGSKSSDSGSGGFFRLTNDFFKGAITVLIVVMVAVVGRSFFRKKTSV